jgi:hypothetical protein
MAAAGAFLPTRAFIAFSSLAVTVALAVLTILALAVGSMRDLHAETASRLSRNDLETIHNHDFPRSFFDDQRP